MIHQATFSEESVQKMKEEGLDVKASVEMKFSAAGGLAASGGASASAGSSTSSESKDSLSSSNCEIKTFVFGGDPPYEDARERPAEAFASWAKTVRFL